jgi:hypothetical protein
MSRLYWLFVDLVWWLRGVLHAFTWRSLKRRFICRRTGHLWEEQIYTSMWMLQIGIGAHAEVMQCFQYDLGDQCRRCGATRFRHPISIGGGDQQPICHIHGMAFYAGQLAPERALEIYHAASEASERAAVCAA